MTGTEDMPAVLRAVYDRADGRCECERPCPSHHRTSADGRCAQTGQAHGNPLTIGPAVVSVSRRPSCLRATDPAQLALRCKQCWREAETTARRQQRQATAFHQPDPDYVLF
jgi:hypothetical protein